MTASTKATKKQSHFNVSNVVLCVGSFVYFWSIIYVIIGSQQDLIGLIIAFLAAILGLFLVTAVIYRRKLGLSLIGKNEAVYLTKAVLKWLVIALVASTFFAIALIWVLNSGIE